VSSSDLQPRRDLTLTHATSLVVGIIIGTGVFLKTASMAQAVGTPTLVLAAWVVAGVVAMLGALCFAELGARLTKAIDFVKGFKASQIDGSEDKAIKITFPSGATRDFTGQSLLLGNSLPNFYFHCTTAYDILRHSGVVLGKRDYLGSMSA